VASAVENSPGGNARRNFPMPVGHLDSSRRPAILCLIASLDCAFARSGVSLRVFRFIGALANEHL
jgi:hypothetical protein